MKVNYNIHYSYLSAQVEIVKHNPLSIFNLYTRSRVQVFYLTDYQYILSYYEYKLIIPMLLICYNNIIVKLLFEIFVCLLIICLLIALLFAN